ncbi:MAG: phosphate transport system regulatory protein PhoU [Alphaproteobacteria bacterium]|nr:MAG: phosphate transport system regulatory protein PhoU [Alphaproteobacteria bacterium]
MSEHHTVRSYDEALHQLRSMITQMGGLAEAQLNGAIEAMVSRNEDRSREIIAADKTIDKLDQDAETMAINLIALRAPLADDLREIVGALKISSILERIGDYAKNIAKRSIALNHSKPVQPAVILPQMADHARVMLKEVLDSYIDRDSKKAVAVRDSDQAIDDLYNSLFRELLTYMMENPGLITPCTHLLFIAKNIERIGDHITNVAEIVYYLVEGRNLDLERPKSDETSFTTVKPPEQE